MTPTVSITNALSFDIEDWFHMVEIEAVADPNTWDSLPTLVERETDWILAALSRHGVRATFFMLGWIAAKYPALVARISAAGHELGTHSFWHRKVYDLTRAAFFDDMKQSIDAIESAGGKKVLGFRAPSFSITPGTEWAFDVLHDLGLRYDASLFPAPRGHGGYPCPMEAHQFNAAPSGTPMPELPMSIMQLGPMRIPFSGGGYMRLLPLAVIRRGFRQLNSRGIPAVVYLHPRDFAPDCPRVAMPLKRKFKCYVGLKSTKGKLEHLLDTFRFDTCARVLGIDEATAPVATS
jgi:polysaccharide deacetylase family protein (PEP-CTERM system associated)